METPIWQRKKSPIFSTPSPAGNGKQEAAGEEAITWKINADSQWINYGEFMRIHQLSYSQLHYIYIYIQYIYITHYNSTISLPILNHTPHRVIAVLHLPSGLLRTILGLFDLIFQQVVLQVVLQRLSSWPEVRSKWLWKTMLFFWEKSHEEKV